MKRSGLTLHNRLLLVALLPAALLATLVTTLVLYRGAETLDRTLHERGNAIVSFLAPAAEYGVISGNRATLQSLLQAAMAQREVSAAAVYDDRGTLLASRGRIGVLEPEALRKIQEGATSHFAPDTLAVVAPITSGGIAIDDELVDGWQPGASQQRASTIGWVHVELDTRPSSREKAFIIWTSFAIVAVGLLLTAVIAVRLARSVSRPVARLVRGVGQMANGALDVAIPEHATSQELSALERGFNTMAHAISENHRTLQLRIDDATALLAYQAQHDPLTGLPNRRVFEQKLDECVVASRRAGDHGALCFIDLDRFKIVNDTCGHAAGDDLLMRIALLIQQRVREQDIICRIGGDEFALILRGCSPSDALDIADELRASIASFDFEWHGRHFSIGASVGMAYIDGSHTDPSDILIAADAACYEAKRSGRNRVVRYPLEAEHQNSPALEGPDSAEAV
ncbi:sensor domain-containing diguanylate cyclase [Aromatoleum petrolei]|uniref:diguanylate cyclase n=1 Tax=Aromatoleum petrolei TaxID=76116 RepID=A0ABX1MMU5_9RHOO|nr:sensor domain-containing diguanylate cyclase [Aromatoleum petrolei]NMF89269.1 diguanylate cyclase [Aromatoleum petrolei]QTQ35022.1 Diguanylate cyclase, GGDEF domain-containing [Aromatoleum petrolei]